MKIQSDFLAFIISNEGDVQEDDYFAVVPFLLREINFRNKSHAAELEVLELIQMNYAAVHILEINNGTEFSAAEIKHDFRQSHSVPSD